MITIKKVPKKNKTKAKPKKNKTGYKSPPDKTKFKPGQSGNPKGRPKGSVSAKKVFEKVLQDTLEIKENGKTKTVSKLEAIFMAIANKSIQCDPKILSILIKVFQILSPHDGEDIKGVSKLSQEELSILENHAELLAMVEELKDD